LVGGNGTEDQGGRRFRRQIALARAALYWEGRWPSLFPVLTFVGIFLAAALLDLFTLLPVWLHILLLAASAGLLCWLLARAFRIRPRTGRQEALRRLERDSGLAHRPLETLEDRPAGNDPAALGLWRLQQERHRARLSALRVKPPAAGWARIDRYAVRTVAGLLLVVGVVAAGGEWAERLERSLLPRIGPAAAAVPARIDAWLSPPDYTRLPPRLLATDAAATEPLPVAQGSRLLVQVQGAADTAALRLPDDTDQPLDKVGGDLFRLETPLSQSGDLAVVVDGAVKASWPLRIVPDEPPAAAFPQPPAASTRNALSIAFQASDDYGLRSLTARIHRVDAPDDAPIVLPMPIASGDPRQAEGETFHDLTAHPWAGLPVVVALEATDAAGQSGWSEAVEVLLPERIFNHPVARQLIALRKHLTVAPADRLPVARALDQIERRPQLFGGDIVVSLALVAAERRLVHDQSDAAVPEVQQLLWDTALHLEEGEVALAERSLRELQQRLQEALANDAPQEEIERLMDELRQAMDRFMQALMEQAARQPPQSLPQVPQNRAEQLRQRDLQRMLDEAREMSRAGQRDQARDLLSQLQRMLENLQVGQMPQPSGAAQQAGQMMQEMEDMIRQQQELLDKSFQGAQRQPQNGGRPEQGQGQSRQPSSGGGQADAQAQEELRRRLGQGMRQMGEMTGSIPQPLGRAEQEMRSARDALSRNAPGEATEPQGNALDNLQQGLSAMLESLMEQFGTGQEQGEGQGFGQADQRGRDPFGRRQDSPGFGRSGEQVEIPDEGALQRAREILDELRRRRGEQGRPPEELHYLDRLLKQF